MKLRQAAEEFLAYLQHEKGCSDLTIIAYRSDFRQFLEFLQTQGIPPLHSQRDHCRRPTVRCRPLQGRLQAGNAWSKAREPEVDVRVPG